MRQALELSTTTQPEATAWGANSVDTLPPAEKMAMSMPLKESFVSSLTVISSSPKGTRVPAERAEARAVMEAQGKWRSARVFSISRPTAPVAPHTATLRDFFMGKFLLLQNLPFGGRFFIIVKRMFAPDVQNCQVMRGFSLSFHIKINKNKVLQGQCL